MGCVGEEQGHTHHALLDISAGRSRAFTRAGYWLVQISLAKLVLFGDRECAGPWNWQAGLGT